MDSKEEQTTEKGKNQADEVFELVKPGITLFKDQYEDGYVVIKVDDHSEIWSVRGKNYSNLLYHKFYEAYDKIPQGESVRQAMQMSQSLASIKGQEYPLHLRVARTEDNIWYDLTNEKWQAIKVTSEGWDVVDNPPILFRRLKSSAPQVLPQKGGDIKQLLKFINLKDPEDEILILVYLVSTLIYGIPHVILVFAGDKGAAKSTAMRVSKRLIDPSAEDLLTMQRSEEGLCLQLRNNYCACYDNLEVLSTMQSNTLCKASTGGAITIREFYQQYDEIVLKLFCCPMVNGINVVVTKEDLIDRCMLFNLERIDPKQRKEESEFWADFEKVRPSILGGMFDTLTEAMRIKPTVELEGLGRMADFYKWGYAIAEALGYSGDAFIQAYQKNIDQGTEEALYNDPVASAIILLGNEQNIREWSGSPTRLLETLSEISGIDRHSKDWPTSVSAFSKRIKKAKSSLAAVNIKVELIKSGDRKINIEFRNKMEKNVSNVSMVSEPSAIKAFDLDTRRAGIAPLDGSGQDEYDAQIPQDLEAINLMNQIAADDLTRAKKIEDVLKVIKTFRDEPSVSEPACCSDSWQREEGPDGK